MQVREAMTTDVQLLDPEQTLQEAARLMADRDIGALPIREGDRLVGLLTDRDITIRAVAEGKSLDTPVREVMTKEIKYCFEDEELSHVAQNMGDIQVKRLVVLDRNKQLVGIVSLADIANTEGVQEAGEAVCGISEPSSEHRAHH